MFIQVKSCCSYKNIHYSDTDSLVHRSSNGDGFKEEDGWLFPTDKTLNWYKYQCKICFDCMIAQAKKYHPLLKFVKRSKMHLYGFIYFISEEKGGAALTYVYDFNTEELMPFLTFCTDWFLINDKKLECGIWNMNDALAIYRGEKTMEEYTAHLLRGRENEEEED